MVVLWFLLFHLSNIMDQIPVLHDYHYSMKRQPLLDPQQPTLTNTLLTILLTQDFIAGRHLCSELFFVQLLNCLLVSSVLVTRVHGRRTPPRGSSCYCRTSLSWVSPLESRTLYGTKVGPAPPGTGGYGPGTRTNHSQITSQARLTQTASTASRIVCVITILTL